MPHLYLLSLLFFSMNHLLSPQAYVASANHYDKCKWTPVFLSDPTWFLGLQVKKTVLRKALGKKKSLMFVAYGAFNVPPPI
jgi:hypothetical protein